MKKGYVSINRQIEDHWLWLQKPFSRGQAWVDMILMANYKPGIIEFHQGHKVEVKRGQLFRSELTLSARWGWNRGVLRRFLRTLKTEQMIEQQTIQQGSIITILKYNNFQISKYSSDTTDDTTDDTTGDTTDGQQTDTNNKNNKKNKEKKEGSVPTETGANPANSFLHEQFSKRFEAKFGTAPVIRYGRDNKNIKALLKTSTAEELGFLYQEYLDTSDVWLAKGNGSLDFFIANINNVKALAAVPINKKLEVAL